MSFFMVQDDSTSSSNESGRGLIAQKVLFFTICGGNRGIFEKRPFSSSH